MLKTLLEKPALWAGGSGPEPDVVLHTAGTLARNMPDVPFPARCNEDERRSVEERVLGALESAGLFSTGQYFPLTELRAREVQMLMERRLVTRYIMEGRGPRGVYLSHDQTLAVAINGRDHVRITALAAGFQPQEVWGRLNLVDDQLGETLDFAFDERHGYLTAKIDEVGTGLRLAAVLHLPGLVQSQQIAEWEKRLRQDHHGLDAFVAGSSDAPGDLFVLANRTTLGRSEEELIYHLRTTARGIIDDERKARETMKTENLSVLADRVGRALGIARGARVLDLRESLALLSAIRLGVATGQIDGYSYSYVDETLMFAQPAHLECRADATYDELGLSLARADYFRERFS